MASRTPLKGETTRRQALRLFDFCAELTAVSVAAALEMKYGAAAHLLRRMVKNGLCTCDMTTTPYTYRRVTEVVWNNP
jgi:hypothetical protein